MEKIKFDTIIYKDDTLFAYYNPKIYRIFTEILIKDGSESLLQTTNEKRKVKILENNFGRDNLLAGTSAAIICYAITHNVWDFVEEIMDYHEDDKDEKGRILSSVLKKFLKEHEEKRL